MPAVRQESALKSMTDIPVFDLGCKTILGYLDSAEIPASVLHDRDCFQLIAYDAPPPPLRPDDLPTAGGMVTMLTFAWHTWGSWRRPGDRYEERGRHVARVLEVDDASLLGKVKGFKWLAERHGDIVRDPVPAAIRGGTRVGR
jgi:hypothetical protein